MSESCDERKKMVIVADVDKIAKWILRERERERQDAVRYPISWPARQLCYGNNCKISNLHHYGNKSNTDT